MNGAAQAIFTPVEDVPDFNVAGFLHLPKELRDEFVSSLTPAEALALQYRWEFWRREKQTPPDWDWSKWVILAGRGFGKTRTGAEWIRDQVENKGRTRLALVGATAADVRDVMVEGDSGILACSPPWNMPEYESGRRRVVWPNGAVALCFSAEEPNRLRGPQHEAAWADELAAWKRPEAWDQLMFGLRLGQNPQVVVTTTPRPTKVIKDLVKDPAAHVTIGTTYENLQNLAPSWAQNIITRYAHTRLGQQELNAAILSDDPRSMWFRDDIEQNRLLVAPDVDEIVVAVDPATDEVNGEEVLSSRAETGIVVAGRLGVRGSADSFGYVFNDVSIQGSPLVWAQRAIWAYHHYKANCIVAEANQGGAMVRSTLMTIDANVPVELVYATRGKFIRAEPVSSLYSQKRISHVGLFADLEDQMCNWVPGVSPKQFRKDRLDAMVWAFWKLMVTERARTKLKVVG